MKIQTEYVQTIVIGGGQAGLSTGYYLAQRGLPFVILDATRESVTHGATAGIHSAYSPPPALAD